MVMGRAEPIGTTSGKPEWYPHKTKKEGGGWRGGGGGGGGVQHKDFQRGQLS